MNIKTIVITSGEQGIGRKIECNSEAYSDSKGGVFSLTHALTISLGPEVRVNSISPGLIDVSTERKRSMIEQNYPLKPITCNTPQGESVNPIILHALFGFFLSPKTALL